MITVEAIPYKSFKDKIRITKELIKEKQLIEIYKDFIYIQKGDFKDEL